MLLVVYDIIIHCREQLKIGCFASKYNFHLFGSRYIDWQIMSEFDQRQTSSLKKKLLELQAQRDALEIEAEAIVNELNSPGPKGEPAVGVKGALVDKEGFPRSDVDVYRARTLRHRLAVINTDHKEISLSIEASMHELHASYHMPLCGELDKQQSSQSSSSGAVAAASAMAAGLASLSVGKSELDMSNCKAFAIIDQILEGSPAQKSGLRNGDRLLAFGSITSSVYANPLTEVPAVVKECYGRIMSTNSSGNSSTANVQSHHILVMVERSKEQLVHELVPATWTGRGLLGCHLTPL